MAGQAPNDPDSGLVTLSGVVFTDHATTVGHAGSKHLTFGSAVECLRIAAGTRAPLTGL